MIVLAVFTVALVRKVYNWGGGRGGVIIVYLRYVE